LGSTTAARGATATTRNKTATRAARASTTALRATAAREGGELLWALAALLDLELNTVDSVGVGGNGGLVTGRGLEVNEGGVL
jgi:hypothetical protein